MGVYLCGGKAAMSQQVFYSLYISPVVEQVCSKCMPQHVRAFLFERSAVAEVFLYYPVNVSCIGCVPFSRLRRYLSSYFSNFRFSAMYSLSVSSCTALSGTSRSLFPFPNILTWFRLHSISFSLSCSNSLRRMPVA